MRRSCRMRSTLLLRGGGIGGMFECVSANTDTFGVTTRHIDVVGTLLFVFIVIALSLDVLLAIDVAATGTNAICQCVFEI